ncbi:1-acyl-sn-glycerol-3-phosphate acyltransferase [Porticoccaceae bacterium]|nr:1-acyl-sn-glycerol-3-phosphate acyltransferase [Porticoccaceae bacterium]
MQLLNMLRSLLFQVGFLTIVIVGSTISCLLFWWPRLISQRLAALSSRAIMLWLQLCCGVKVVVIGRENIPAEPVVILSNHQSTWETFFFWQLFQPMAFILKRELLRIPLFGWALATTKPIAISRGNPGGAIRHVLRAGRARLKAGSSVIIYPEGTRRTSQTLQPYKTSGAALAKAAGAAILPVYHNAGICWPVESWRKQPGVITVVIGKPIESAGEDARALTLRAQEWAHKEAKNIN